MDTIFNSFLLVAATEMGDKTQLLAFVLVSRFKKPWAIIAGIFVATVLNHLLASTVGAWVAGRLSPVALRWILAISFFAFAAWTLIPDKDDEDAAGRGAWGAFFTTTLAFFLAEMGDKTQLATVALAAAYQDVVRVTIGTTLGMMLSDGLAVFFGEWITRRLPLPWLRRIAAVLFVAFGVWMLLHD